VIKENSLAFSNNTNLHCTKKTRHKLMLIFQS